MRMEHEDDDLLWVLFVEELDGSYLAIEMDGECPRYAGIEDGPKHLAVNGNGKH